MQNSYRVIYNNFIVAVVSFGLLTLWLHQFNPATRLDESLPVTIFFGIWVVVFPLLVKWLKLTFTDFKVLHSPKSEKWLLSLNMWRYMKSLEVPPTLLIVRNISYQLIFMFSISVIYKFLISLEQPLYITIPFLTLGVYVCFRTLLYSSLVLMNFAFDFK